MFSKFSKLNKEEYKDEIDLATSKQTTEELEQENREVEIILDIPSQPTSIVNSPDSDCRESSTAPIHEPLESILEFCKICEMPKHELIDCPVLNIIFRRKLCPICSHYHDWQQCPIAFKYFMQFTFSPHNAHSSSSNSNNGQFYFRNFNRTQVYQPPRNNYYDQQSMNNRRYGNHRAPNGPNSNHTFNNNNNHNHSYEYFRPKTQNAKY